MSAVAPAAPPVDAARLLDLDPDLAIGMEPGPTREAYDRAVVPALTLPAGPFDMRTITGAGLHAYGTLVTGGLIVRDVLLGDTVASELLGPGDVVGLEDDQPWIVPVQVRWAVAEPASLALLDDRLLPVLRAWPQLGRALLERSAQRALRLETQRAISQLARVEDRLVALFGMLAERFARMTPSGVVISVSLTHAMLGRLVGARRPTVSLALKALGDEGTVVRRGDGSWLLANHALQALDPSLRDAVDTRPEAVLLAPPATPPVERSGGLDEADRRHLDERYAEIRMRSREIREQTLLTLARAQALRARPGVRT